MKKSKVDTDASWFDHVPGKPNGKRITTTKTDYNGSPDEGKR
jgi:hypothetical protein